MALCIVDDGVGAFGVLAHQPRYRLSAFFHEIVRGGLVGEVVEDVAVEGRAEDEVLVGAEAGPEHRGQDVDGAFEGEGGVIGSRIVLAGVEVDVAVPHEQTRSRFPLSEKHTPPTWSRSSSK